MDVADLYHAPLEGFIARRKELVQQLRRTDPQQALVVGKLRKPSPAAWAIDQLAVDAPDLVTELLAAGSDAVEAQRAASGGAGRSDLLRDASARVREAVESAVRAAVAVLQDAGHAADEQSARRIRTTLQAAITSGRDQRAALWRGVLDRDLDPTGFGLPEHLEDDQPELAEVIAPSRKRPALRRGGSPPPPAQPVRDGAALRVAARASADKDRLAERARAMAVAKRQNAERLGEQAQLAEEEAMAAEQAAQTAEAAAEVARQALKAAASHQPARTTPRSR